MDDDIDIEEHDVLDNPRIKSMFPDLSRVKIEIPEEEDIDETYNHEELELKTEEPQEMLYQNEYSFETMPEDVGETGENEEYEEDNEYFYNNQIILGSKPPIDPEVLYQEALESNPIVYLENWEVRLKTSPCYCETCAILFPTVNALDAHKMISHSYLVALDSPMKNTARKSTVPSKYCNHCSNTFPDDTSLIKHLYELLPLNNFPKNKEDKAEPDVIRKVPSTSSVPWPKKVKGIPQAFPKIVPKKIKVEKEVKIEPEVKTEVETKSKYGNRDGKFFAASSLVPQSTLFQCKICQVAFVSCFSALQHSRSCEKSAPFEKCGVCKRKIRPKDAKLHKLQHNYNDKLKIYTVTKNTYYQILCKCPKCLACFDELGFWAHYPKCKREKKITYCSDCDLNIATIRYQNHCLKHTVKKFTKKDFILIEFHDLKAKKSSDVVSTKTQEEVKSLIKKTREAKNDGEKAENGITLYYCEFCGCCQCKLTYKGHENGLCKEKIASQKKYCDKCGLSFSTKSYVSHLNLHEKYSFKLQDIKIISLTTGKEIDPPMPELYKCKDCTKHFLYRQQKRSHKCKTEKFTTCKICAKKFNLQAYKIHKLFHKADKLIPELLKKYNSIQSTWNIMYMCATCNLVTMTYDSAITHAQGHLNYLISDFPMTCKVCELKIAEKEFGLHEKLHSNNESINRESFKILNYSYENLFKTDWLTMFDELPEQDRQQILSQSIYRYTRSIKMQIEVNASTDDYKYFCMNCNSFVNGPEISEHIRTECTKSLNYVCTTCGEIFKNFKQFLSHDIHDEGIKNSSIVTFNNECDKDFNSHLNMIESKTKPTPKKVSNKVKNLPLSKLSKISSDNSANNKKIYKIYKCLKCSCCVNLLKSVERHSCVISKADRWFCQICGQYFFARGRQMHMAAHKKKPQITKDKIAVITFNGKEKILPEKRLVAKILPEKRLVAKILPEKRLVAKILPEKRLEAKILPEKRLEAKILPEKSLVAKIFQCKCGLHFTSQKTIETHVMGCSPNLIVSKESCSKCKLLFPTDVLVTHLVNHHNKPMKFEIEKYDKAIFWKCSSCEIHFLSRNSIAEHYEDCDPQYAIQCTSCKLNFTGKGVVKHLCSNKDITYVNKVTIFEKDASAITVFKCADCDICYLRRNSFNYHYFDVQHRLYKPPSVCTHCGLKFTHCSLQKHLKLHKIANRKFQIKVLNPLTGDSNIVTGINGSNDDDDKRSTRKRKLELDNSALIKNEKFSSRETRTPERKSLRLRLNDTPSTSKDELSTSKDTPSTSKDTPSTSKDVSISDSDEESTSISKKLKSRILVQGYSNRLYKCVICNQHYMKEASFDYHAKNHRLQELSENHECDICHLEFSRYTLPRHKYVHHDCMKVKREDFIIFTETANSKEQEILDRIESLRKAERLKSENVKQSKNENHDDTLNVSDDICQTGNINDICQTDIDKIVYYKCFDCNVCFLNHDMCLQHTKNHESIDSLMYIECKICNFQFLIDSLKEHMVLHHANDFKIENLTVHEFKAAGLGLDPKIDIYQAVDKVQSRLVSTTTDVGII
ncbi:zinc finger protein 91 [Helicoverpa armigera]|uniref:zinc finger protein 91 n=1 Tax=Helicoverpa armigera TaxID=29058 RepID=UPI0030838774